MDEQFNSKTSSIEICARCRGHGYTTREEITDYHRNEGDIIKTECRKCEGSGRVNVIYTRKVFPLSAESDD